MKEGFYIVTYLTEKTIARWNDREKCFYCVGSQEPYNLDEFDSIGSLINIEHPPTINNFVYPGTVELGTQMNDDSPVRPVERNLPQSGTFLGS